MRIFISSLFSILLLQLQAQMPHQPSAAEIYQDMKKLAVLGNVLYLAAHPDDENTRFIAYSANEMLYNTAYLSLTRGDGGQNLVGPELREELGIIRTQELLAARRTDGGLQFFSRANDFGYSKTAEETLDIWDKEKILSDVVRVIRQFRPDVIVCRFPTDGGGGHGHHTASALLGLEAFSLAGDKNAFPEQLNTLEVWQPTRIVVNTGRWWNPDISAEDPGVVALDIGTYNSVLGTSYNEMAARSRTMHKSQGFGSTGSRGEQLEYFEHLKGEQAKVSLFEGFDSDWTRVSGSSAISKSISVLIESYDIEHPEASIDKLGAIYRQLQDIDDAFWKEKKKKEIAHLIYDCAGLYLEVSAENYWASPGDSVKLSIEMTTRAIALPIGIGYNIELLDIKQEADSNLEKNFAHITELDVVLPAMLPYSQQYWLQEEGTLGTYKVSDSSLIGTPENKAALSVDFQVTIGDLTLNYERPVIYKWNDPVQGERYRPFVITPPVFSTFSQSSHLFTPSQSKEITVQLKSVAPNFKGKLVIAQEAGWEIQPSEIPFTFQMAGEEQSFSFTVKALSNAKPFDLKAQVISASASYDRALNEIDYDHIPAQVYMPAASTRLVYIDLKTAGKYIGYIAGAGDIIPEALRNIGYQVDELLESDIRAENLKKYDAIVTGIRLLNVDERIQFYMPELLKYCEEGGTLVMQYNTRHALKTDVFSPYPITLSRDRVTEEDAEVTFLKPKHPVLNSPNLITQADFENWVQERGLYFPSEWDKEYTAILSWHDVDEEAKDGSLLVAEYGKGHFVYTGISFFRELPAGVPGAYRLLVNLISWGND